MNNSMKNICIKNMKTIIAAHAEDLYLADISDEQIEPALVEISKVKVLGKGTGTFTVKQFLYNLENFRTEVRSNMEPKIFEIWLESYKFLTNNKPALEPDAEILFSAESASLQEVKAEAQAGIKAKTMTGPESVTGNESEVEPQIEGKPEKEVVEEPDPEIVSGKFEKFPAADFPPPEKFISTEVGKNKTQSATQKVRFQRRRRDWFDMILDIAAALMERFTREKDGRKNQ